MFYEVIREGLDQIKKINKKLFGGIGLKKKNRLDAKKTKVLYQKMGSRWYAITKLANGETYFAPVPKGVNPKTQNPILYVIDNEKEAFKEVNDEEQRPREHLHADVFSEGELLELLDLLHRQISQINVWIVHALIPCGIVSGGGSPGCCCCCGCAPPIMPGWIGIVLLIWGTAPITPPGCCAPPTPIVPSGPANL